MGFLLHASCPPCPPKRKFSRINWKLDTHTFWQFKSSEITSDHWFNNGKEPWIQRVQELLSHPADTWNSTSHTHSRCAPWHHPKTLPCTQLPLCIFQDPAVCFITTGDKKGSPAFSWFSLKPKHWIHTSPNIHIRQPKHSWFYLKLIVAQGSSVILDWARWWKMLAFWKGFFRWRSLCCSWTCNLLQAMWLLWYVVVVLHHNAVDHDASVQPPFTVRSAVQSLLNQQWDSVYLFDEFVLKFTGWTWWSAITPSECNFHSFSQVFLFGCKNLLWKWPVRKKFNLFFSLGSPRAPPKSQIAPFSQHPKSSKFGYSLSSKKEKRKKHTGFLFDTFFEVRNHQGNRCLWKLNILNPITCSKG